MTWRKLCELEPSNNFLWASLSGTKDVFQHASKTRGVCQDPILSKDSKGWVSLVAQGKGAVYLYDHKIQLPHRKKEDRWSTDL